MVVRGTVRVRARSEGARPSASDVSAAAEKLRIAGFEVLRVGRFGISVAADGERFERILGVRPEPGQPLVAQIAPSDAELGQLVDQLEVASKPESY